jgi:hypothetical protein
MRALKIATVVMGILIIVATTALVVAVIRRHGTTPTASPPTAINLDTVLHEPAGTRIASIAALQDQLAIQLEGGGPTRIVLIDIHSGNVTGHIRLTP